MLESKIQAGIIAFLKKRGWLVIKIITCTVAGFPDLQVIKKGEIVFIEVKQPGNKPTPLQQYVHGLLKDHGFQVIVAEKVEDVSFLS